MVIPLLGISPKGTINSAVQRFLCRDVLRHVIYKGGNWEAVWTHRDGEWVIHPPEFGLALESICEGRMLSHKGTSWSKLNEEAGRMVAGAGGREGARERARGQSEDGTCWENRPAFTFSVSYCSGSRCQTLSFRLGLEKEKVWVDRAKGRGADTGQAFPQGDRHPAACPGSTQRPRPALLQGLLPLLASPPSSGSCCPTLYSPCEWRIGIKIKQNTQGIQL